MFKPCIKVAKKMENDASDFVLLQIKSFPKNIVVLYKHKYHFVFIQHIINKVLKLNKNIEYKLSYISILTHTFKDIKNINIH